MYSWDVFSKNDYKITKIAKLPGLDKKKQGSRKRNLVRSVRTRIDDICKRIAGMRSSDGDIRMTACQSYLGESVSVTNVTFRIYNEGNELYHHDFINRLVPTSVQPNSARQLLLAGNRDTLNKNPKEAAEFIAV